MPVYVYECDHCSHRLEVRLSSFEPARMMACPECGGSARLTISPTSFTFGFKLSDRSHERGGPLNEYVRDV